MSDNLSVSVDEAPGFEKRWAAVKVALIALMSLFVLAGLAGVFGRGPLSHATVKGPGGITVAYERFCAAGTPGQLSVDVKAPTGGSLATVAFDRPASDHLIVSATHPRSTSETVSPEATTYAFQTGPDGRGTIVFSIQPTKAGPAQGAVTVNGRRLPLQFIVWP